MLIKALHVPSFLSPPLICLHTRLQTREIASGVCVQDHTWMKLQDAVYSPKFIDEASEQAVMRLEPEERISGYTALPVYCSYLPSVLCFILFF